jgi:DNA-binding LacI/PurR family transcriptional regulator
LRAVARLAGVSVATASRVLNGHPHVGQLSAAAVRRAVERLGYRSDPMLRALGRYRWPAGRRSPTPALALLLDRWTARSQGHVAALRQRAKGLGYRLEAVQLRPDTDLAGLATRLEDCGVGGLIVDIHGDAIALDLPWERFAAVIVGEGLPDLALPRVSTDWSRVAADAVARLRARGCRRIGIIVRSYPGRGLRDELLGAAHGALALAGPVPDGSVLLTSTELAVSDGAVAAWFAARRPDGVIGDTPAQLRQLRAAGAIIPASCAFLSLLRAGERIDRLGIAGYRIDLEQRVQRAVDLLHARLLHGERGLEREPARLLLMEARVEGGSMGPG